jgi:hypothetical protein
MVVFQFPAAVALGLGSSVIGRDIGERRLGFYFARPLSGIAIWGGKMLAAFALLVAAALLASLPVYLLANPFEPSGKPGPFPWQPLLTTMLFWILLMSAAAVASGALRSRSGLIIVDIVGLPLVATVFFEIGERMVGAGATRAVVSLATPPRALVLLWPVVVVLLAASAAQVAFGRVEARRGHLALSAVTLSGLLACAAAFGIYGLWLTSATPSDLRSGFVSAPPNGEWVMLSGGTRRTDPPELYFPGFLVNAATGEHVKMGGVAFGGSGSGPIWSADGRRILWPTERLRSIDLRSAQVGGPELSIVEAGTESTARLTLANQPGTLFYVAERGELRQQPLAVSSDGRALFAARDALRLVDLESGRETARVAGRAGVALFLPGGGARLLAMEPRGAVSEWRVFDWDGKGNRVEPRAEFSTEGAAQVRFSTNGDRLLVVEPRRLSLQVLDGSGLKTLIDPWPALNRAAVLASEGRVASVEENGSGLELHVLAPDGATTASATIPGKFPVRFGGEPVPGLLSIGVDRWDTAYLRETVFIDLATGQVRRRETDLTPAARWDFWSAGPAPASASTRLFWDSHHALVRLDPATGERRVLVVTRGLGDRE